MESSSYKNTSFRSGTNALYSTQYSQIFKERQTKRLIQKLNDAHKDFSWIQKAQAEE